jgi:HPt (histidine-containing phosphotransfer) domain-containing protein
MSADARGGLDALTASFLQHKLAEFRLLSEAPVPDFTALAVAAHRLRGTGGAYGFDRLSEAAAVLEQAAQSRDADAARAVLDQVNQLIRGLVGD